MNRTLQDLGPVLLLLWRGPRGKLLFGLSLGAATVLSGLALLGLSGWFITATAIAGLNAATAIAFDVFSPSAGIRFFALARTASRYGERLVTHDATLRVLADLRERLFRGSAAMREAENLRMRPAALLFRLTQDIDALDSLYLRIIVPLVAAVSASLAVIIIFGWVRPTAGFASGAFLLAIGLAIPSFCARAASGPARRRMQALDALRSRVIDMVSGQTEFIFAGQLGAQRRKIADANGKLSDADDKLNLVEIITGAAFGIASAAFVASVLYLALTLERNGEIGAPVAALFILIAVAALEPFTALRRGAIELGRTRISARRVAPRLNPVAQRGFPLPPHGIACSIDGVSVRHAFASAPTIRDLSLTIRRGERVALIGVSGSGKSTLMSIIAGELSPEQGVVECVSTTLLTQRTELFVDTLRDNLRLADESATDHRLEEVMDSAGLAPCLAGLPNGLDTRLGEGGLGLSGGEARRLALARLFLRDTPLWLLDEPTEGLDDATARDVLERLTATVHDRTLLLATHVRREAEIADRLVLMKHGRIVAEAARGEAQFEVLLASLRQD